MPTYVGLDTDDQAQGLSRKLDEVVVIDDDNNNVKRELGLRSVRERVSG